MTVGAGFNISIHILHTDLYKFPVVLARRIVIFKSRVILWGELDAKYSKGLKSNAKCPISQLQRSQR